LFFDLWAIHNTERHGSDVAEQKVIRQVFLKSPLDELYSLREATMPTNRHMFHPTATMHLELQ
jgi:hypothetical protein